MPAKLPRGVEAKRPCSFSLEPSWKERFLISCYNMSKQDNKNIVASELVREFIIQTTLKFEGKLNKGENNE